MRRRGLTTALGAVLTALLMIGIGSVKLPYVLLGAGPTVDTLGAVESTKVISVEGAPTSDSKGQLRLVTVSIDSSVDLLSAIRGWISDEQAVVPREVIYPPDQSTEEIEEQNQQDFANSQSSAETAALRELGYPVQVTVKEVIAGSPSEGRIKTGDVIKAVDGQPVTSVQKLVELVKAKPAGTQLNLEVNRAGAAIAVAVTSRPASQSDSTPRIGIAAENKQPHPFTLTIKLEDIGGPSAGMMFALGIIDKLKPEDLTGGVVIAGTGTIDDEGRVGAIGGIPQKLVGARDAGATVFLTPAENCAEAKANQLPGLRLVKVSTLDDALAALTTLRAGGQLPGC